MAVHDLIIKEIDQTRERSLLTIKADLWAASALGYTMAFHLWVFLWPGEYPVAMWEANKAYVSL